MGFWPAYCGLDWLKESRNTKMKLICGVGVYEKGKYAGWMKGKNTRRSCTRIHCSYEISRR